MDRSKLEVNTCKLYQAREKGDKRGTIGFGFSSHWLRKWNELELNWKPL